MPTVHISETFDLSTKAGKLGLIGIHTPPRSLVELHYGPLMSNYRKIRFLGADVVLACASTLPLDPLKVGDGATLFNPADAMNPILYKAVSNNSFETLVAKIKGALPVLPSSAGSSIDRTENIDTSTTNYDDFDVYYGILSATFGWKKSMPQTGLVMRNLRPLMYPLLSDIGNDIMSASGNIVQDSTISNNRDTTSYSGIGRIARGKAQRAPALPLWQGIQSNSGILSPIPSTFPTTYVGAVIVPPCHTNGSVTYYRLRITWHIRFEGLCPYTEHSPFANFQMAGGATYWADYTGSSKDFEHDESTLSTNGFEIEKVM
ncbi:putative capsid protein [Bovine faeces associated smacovirus 1]|uniref:Putative capsid protein n=1 Tax=Bovine faeces associated smacovirus 1 TaxID=1843749 RepID=A0A160HX16_9VIRU|nr:putative capsid protein [Bovine faeces associated smacovirus 1]ANC51533.1 putative capsid protein [Bovine faeces associated smacovirus 1]